MFEEVSNSCCLSWLTWEAVYLARLTCQVFLLQNMRGFYGGFWKRSYMFCVTVDLNSDYLILDVRIKMGTAVTELRTFFLLAGKHD